MQEARIQKIVVECLGKVLSKELTYLTSLKFGSVLRNHSVESLKVFSWSDLLEKAAPISLSLFKHCAHAKRRVRKCKGRSGRSIHHLPDEETAIGMCFAILLCARSQRMNLVQHLLSMLLYGSHAPKQVCTCT